MNSFNNGVHDGDDDDGKVVVVGNSPSSAVLDSIVASVQA